MRLDPTSLWPQAAPFFDKLVFSKIKLRLGGRVKLIVTGGAPLARHVEDFLKVTMCCPVVQGYGLTETCAASFIAVPDSQVRRRSPPSVHTFFGMHVCTPLVQGYGLTETCTASFLAMPDSKVRELLWSTRQT